MGHFLHEELMGNRGKSFFHIAGGFFQGCGIFDVQNHAALFGLVGNSIRTDLQYDRKAQPVSRRCRLGMILG